MTIQKEIPPLFSMPPSSTTQHTTEMIAEPTTSPTITTIQSTSLPHAQPGHDSVEIDYEALPESATIQAQLLAGAFAGIMEHSVMFPIDAIKTRMQSLNTKNVYTGVLNAITKISSTEGSFALFKGLNSMILGAGPAHAVYFGTYEFVKRKLIDDSSNPKEFHTFKTAIAGSCATIAADALMNPFDTIKQRMQLGSNKLPMLKLANHMYKTEGFRSFYTSYPTTLSMTVPFAALNFTIYETSTKILNPTNAYDPIIHCFCGGLSGATCAAITTPLDCIKTLLQIRGESKTQEIRNISGPVEGAKTIYKLYGWKGFWRGVKPRVIANVPAAAISWTSYEMAKHFLLD